MALQCGNALCTSEQAKTFPGLSPLLLCLPLYISIWSKHLNGSRMVLLSTAGQCELWGAQWWVPPPGSKHMGRLLPLCVRAKWELGQAHTLPVPPVLGLNRGGRKSRGAICNCRSAGGLAAHCSCNLCGSPAEVQSAQKLLPCPDWPYQCLQPDIYNATNVDGDNWCKCVFFWRRWLQQGMRMMMMMTRILG